MQGTHRLGQDRASPPRHPTGRNPGNSSQDGQYAHPAGNHCAVAEARSTLTPGPMVELSETFFR